MNVVLTIGAIIGILAIVPYIKSILDGRTKPQLVTWAIWATLAIIMTVSAFWSGQTASAILSLQNAVGCSAVIAISWRRGSLSVSRSDVVYLLGAVAGILSLVVLRDPVIALIVSVSVDAMAFIPTLIHGWQAPHEENLPSFALSASAGAITLAVAISASSGISGLLYPLYSMSFNLAMAGILLLSHSYLRSLANSKMASIQEA